jgi:hypothetical protein
LNPILTRGRRLTFVDYDIRSINSYIDYDSFEYHESLT